MLTKNAITPPAVYLIADHLDAILAAGEDLRRLSVAIPPVKNGLTADTAAEIRAFVEGIQAFELTIILRTLEARKRIADLSGCDKMLSLILSLFAGGTAALVDSAIECGDTANIEFASAGDPLDYLRSRHLLSETTGSLIGCLSISASDDTLIAGRVPLGVILNHAAAALDALDNYFAVYSEAERPTDGTAPAGDAELLAPAPT